jgi:hypothetical protein
MMTFFLVESAAVRSREDAMRASRRTVITGFRQDGELLTLSEIVIDSTAAPTVQVPQLLREARGVYSGTRRGRVVTSGGPSILPQVTGQIALTEAEVAAGVENASEFWRRRCVGPRV